MTKKSLSDVELLLPEWLVPIVPDGFLPAHGVAVRDGKIVATGHHTDLRERFPEAQLTPLPGQVLLPGFVNVHTHAAMTLLRGLADDLPLMVWLREHIWPAEGRFVAPDFVRVGTRLAIAEMLRGGTTCFNDMYFFPQEAAEVAQEMGMRMVLGHVIIDFPTTYTRNAEDALRLAAEHIAILGNPALLRHSIAPHAPYTVSDGPLQEAAALARQHGSFLHMHVHETAGEVRDALARDDRRPLRRLHELGLLNERFLAVHMTQLNEDDLAICKETGLQIAHCPESNLKLGSGIAPVATLLVQGQGVGLGTDGAASNNDLDMLGELRTAALLAKGREGDPTALPAKQALYLATLGGARALGWEKETGSLEVGKAADCIAISLDHPATSPVYDPISQLVYCAGRDQVRNVWVAGVQKIQDGRALHWDDAELGREAQDWALRIARENS
ncbi:TRZ/ATZ family hydrolase [Acidithiobacillus sp. CV18-2]|uniref:TRZ/ATZ family hydrolase n=1 Tax=Igneacidithiobacillus copahuensis TaxID=2724909 RepID=A0AAE2YSG9_9PROT|nr:TRZ/ATZ family hydrolase [Acidithiobacillus sp. CV18-3]MBU2757333.1 TRZ/ATZ family hydrolase [Acidithiobacillus sp. BN09-2]MBU2776088.1 TRZ/ATZ family hydrolase [Acidithiobacillus sp. CV18-2]MBU2789311.1 TRZ/ATZ family hydrolase [Igneacidithiobacillus copahuensis]MBU2795415.1 TRZ/ATZ family hydrolase [Acidithiobacillus sp. VAN18-2]MBU2800235.1 TRZ/ATZ family hydrolase [Acidithiobacillus sp. VAN18-4]UTV82307.1 TRZ/ATZ family hydrolase [Acidithiobacillus sp. YTS05]